MNSNTGLLQLYIGDGKGKTTAAVGLLVRASGTGLRTLLAQFLKGQDSGELGSLQALGIPVWRCASTEKFVFQMSGEELAACKRETQSCFERIREAVASGEYDVVALDEVLDAVGLGLVDEQALVDMVRTRPPHTEMVLTGRNPCAALRDMADYISEIQAVKHPYEKGVCARAGIEY